MYRLANLADSAAFERKGSRVDNGLVTVVERLQPKRPVELEPALRRTENRDAPIALMRVLDEARNQYFTRVRTPDRIAGDDCDTADDAISKKRRAVLCEEVRLVPAQRERSERVCAETAHELACTSPVTRLLVHAMTPRR